MTEVGSKLIWKWCIKLGLPTLAYGTGLALMIANPGLFWPGTTIAGIGAAIATVHWWYSSRRQPPGSRGLGFAICSAALGVIAWLIWRPAPLNVVIDAQPANYAGGTDYYGIKWDAGLSELDVSLSNPTDEGYSDVDIFVRTDLVIYQAGQDKNTINDCSILPENPGFDVHGLTIYGTDESGRSVTIPLVPVRPGPIISSSYRIHCASFAPRSALFAVFALTKFGSQAHEMPIWAKASVQYVGAGRRRSAAVTKCFYPAANKIMPECSTS